MCDKSLFVERVNENAMYNKTVIEFAFCDITKTSSSNCLLSGVWQKCQNSISGTSLLWDKLQSVALSLKGGTLRLE